MSSDRKVRIEHLESEIRKLRVEEANERRSRHVALVEALVHGMSYDEMGEVMAILQDKVSKRWAHDHDDDE